MMGLLVMTLFPWAAMLHTASPQGTALAGIGWTLPANALSYQEESILGLTGVSLRRARNGECSKAERSGVSRDERVVSGKRDHGSDAWHGGSGIGLTRSGQSRCLVRPPTSLRGRWL
jgi:hypothetical protein